MLNVMGFGKGFKPLTRGNTKREATQMVYTVLLDNECHMGDYTDLWLAESMRVTASLVFGANRVKVMAKRKGH